MKKGSRSVYKLCACGCGQTVPPTISKTTGRVSRYPKFIPTHGSKDWGKRLALHLKTSPHPNAKPLGSKQIRADGYIRIKTENGWVYEHRHLLSALPEHIVHHKDGNPSNNVLENLEQMFESAHLSIHHTLPANQWSKHFKCCVECQTVERKHAASGRCTRCYQQRQAKIDGYWP
jgi:hypothetical protein